MLAAGSSLLVEHLNLEWGGVEQKGRRGYVVVNKYSGTNVEGIYAVGDVTGNVEEKGKSTPVSKGPSNASTDAKRPSPANARIINC